MEFDVFIEQDETGAFIAKVPLLPGCHTYGATKREAIANVREAIQAYLEAEGLPPGRFIGIEKVRVEA